VRDRKAVCCGAHPPRQVVERHVDAAEDEQDGEDEVGEDRHLADAQPDRRVCDAERRARERSRHHRERQPRQRAGGQVDVEQEHAEGKADERDAEADRHHGQAAAEEQRHPARGRREQ
jgi:hypothetical protein